METPDDGSALMVREAYTHRGDTNVIVVDAQRLEAGPWYFKAAENTWYIGRIAAQFIDYLVSRGLKLSKTHLVGHSLGAQSAGVAGGSLQSGLVSRITGLDPALPLFDKLSLSQRLDPSDAEFVDVIHTDAGIFGFKQQVGHVDFYPNGGISPQPGCELEVVIPKQLVLNKCDNDTKLNGFFVFQLQDKHSYKNTNTIANNDINSLQTIRRQDITKEKEDTRKHRLLERPNTITDTISKKIIKRPKRTFIKLRQHTGRFQEKSQIAKVFRKYKRSDSTKSTNDKNQKIYERLKRNGLKIKIPNHIQRLFNPVFTKSQTIEDDELIEKTFDTKITKNAISKTQNTFKGKSEKLHHRQCRFISFFKRPQNSENMLFDSTKCTNDENKKINERLERNGLKIKILNHIQRLFHPVFTKPQTIQDDELIEKTSDTKTTKNAISKTQNTFKRIKRSQSKSEKPHQRQRRFISFFKRPQNSENMLFKILDFLIRNRQKITPTISIIREISTIVKTSSGIIQNVIKEQNNIIGDNSGNIKPISSTYNFEIANESKIKSFLRKLLGLGQGNKLIVTAST
ncbi:uncharacterized protein [Maniola hyperantus]|uniref:uncharacterized protein isoform X1 n=1 Tax=Aphantopus hyperantus TaxID=2795564 RepID=UPI003749A04B